MKAYDGSKPTVGRIVHFHAQDDSQPLACIITKVYQNHGEAMPIDAAFFQPASGIGPLVGGLVAVGFSEEPKAGHWTWPPRV